MWQEKITNYGHIKIDTENCIRWAEESFWQNWPKLVITGQFKAVELDHCYNDTELYFVEQHKP